MPAIAFSEEACENHEVTDRYLQEIMAENRYNETVVSEGRISYMVEGIRNYDAGEGTDLKAIFDHCVSIGIAANIS